MHDTVSSKSMAIGRALIAAAAVLLGAALSYAEQGRAAPQHTTPIVFHQFTSSPHLQLTAGVITQLGKGKLLVANRRLSDPNFAQTVILLLEYSREGAMGVVLNRPTDIGLATVLPQIKALKKRKDTVSLGGPVGRDQVLLLAQSSRPPENSQQIFGQCYIVVSQTALLRLIGNGNPGIKLRAFVGYAGWAPGQLDAEVARQDWHIRPADVTTVFSLTPDRMWPELIKQSEFEWAGR
ncbi:MAG TPA: YqgE/AlgH family protein [Methylomirabilota bacterium]|jgi:putative transcriptional regulator|nr:YqgE/AlgH family protein [Methylomirabilota bacterium]